MKKISCVFILLLFLVSYLQISGNADHSILSKSIVRIDITDEHVTLPRESDILGGKPDKYIDIIIPNIELSKLSYEDIDYSFLNLDKHSISQSYANEYHTIAEMEQILQDIANSYPSITNLYSIGESYEGRNIWCLEITDNPGIDEEEPGVFYMGLHHAREWPTLEICLYIAENLTSSYGSDPDITDIINNRRLWLVPCVNPDGYYYDHDLHQGVKWWRKNRHYLTEFGTYGIDLNRNYAGSCNGAALGMWGSTGMSHNPDNELYCGQEILSELETKAIRNVFLENDICGSISWHTHGELVIWPWGYSTDDITPDDEYLSQIGEEIASRITTQDGYRTYTPSQSAGLYPTSGDTTDWAYGYSHYIMGRPTFAYTIEACNSFHPDPVVLDQVCAENFDGAIYFLQEAGSIKDVIPRVIPPVIEEMDSDDDGEYIISWVEVNPKANPDYFQIDELTDLSLIIDDAESGSSAWNLNDFSLSASRYHSYGYSYKSHRVDNSVSSITSVYPIPIVDGMSLSFWCWYDIENNYDMAFVEVSKDGRFYDVLDKFTDSSGGWTYRSYNLDEYSGDSVFIRFRYSTDENTHGEGFYVDDILPVADFGTVNTLSSSITNMSYGIIEKAEGIYYYRIKGYNSKHGWGDFSTLERIDVSVENNNPPNTPTINGLVNGKAGEKYEYMFVTTDADGDDIYYFIEWGDSDTEEWLGPYGSGEEITINHTWHEKGDYTIRAKAKDEHDLESYWGVLLINMPKNKHLSMFLLWFEKLLNFLSLF
jgi:hypothetical protein